MSSKQVFWRLTVLAGKMLTPPPGFYSHYRNPDIFGKMTKLLAETTLNGNVDFFRDERNISYLRKCLCRIIELFLAWFGDKKIDKVK